MRFPRSAFLLVVLVIFTQFVRAEDPEVHLLLGTWRARSLSNPELPIVITLATDGKATERIGDYHGTGTWKPVGGGIRIAWAGGWSGLLRPTSQGRVELLTWKKGTPIDGPPDDTQPAVRIKDP